MTRRIRRPAPQSTADLDTEVSEYLLNRSTRERAAYHENKWKAKFMDLLEMMGEALEGGHRVLHLNEPLVFSSYNAGGKMTERQVLGIRRTRRESTDPQRRPGDEAVGDQGHGRRVHRHPHRDR